jgi:hypothetical protein
MYVGLFSFTSLVVFGLTGLVVTFQAGPQRSPAESQTRSIAFRAAPNASDREVAAAVYRRAQLPLAAPVPDWAVQRDAQHRLVLDFYTVNGIRKITVIEDEGRLRIDSVRNSLPDFINDVHAITLRWAAPDLRLKLWTWYNEIAIASLLVLCFSGAYLWLSSRPLYRLARYAVILGLVCFAAFCILTR